MSNIHQHYTWMNAYGLKFLELLSNVSHLLLRLRSLKMASVFLQCAMLLVKIFGFSDLRIFVLTKNCLWGVKLLTTFSFNLSITNLRNGRQLARLYFSAVVLLFVLLKRLKVLSSLKLDEKLKIWIIISHVVLYISVNNEVFSIFSQLYFSTWKALGCRHLVDIRWRYFICQFIILIFPTEDSQVG